MRENPVARTVFCIALAPVVASALTSGVGGAVASDPTQSSDTPQIEVCHVPAGNAQLITVSEQGGENGHSNHEHDIRMDQHSPHHPDHQHDATTMCEHHGGHAT